MTAAEAIGGIDVGHLTTLWIVVQQVARVVVAGVPVETVSSAHIQQWSHPDKHRGLVCTPEAHRLLSRAGRVREAAEDYVSQTQWVRRNGRSCWKMSSGPGPKRCMREMATILWPRLNSGSQEGCEMGYGLSLP